MTVFLIVIRQTLIDVMSTKHTPIVVISSEVEKTHGFCRHLDQTNGVSAWRDPLTRSTTLSFRAAGEESRGNVCCCIQRLRFLHAFALLT